MMYRKNKKIVIKSEQLSSLMISKYSHFLSKNKNHKSNLTKKEQLRAALCSIRSLLQ